MASPARKSLLRRRRSWKLRLDNQARNGRETRCDGEEYEGQNHEAAVIAARGPRSDPGRAARQNEAKRKEKIRESSEIKGGRGAYHGGPARGRTRTATAPTRTAT